MGIGGSMGVQSRAAWVLSAFVILFSWLFLFGVVFPSVPRSQWIGIAFEIMLVSGLLLLLINVLTRSRRIDGASYRFLMIWGASLPLAVTYLSSIALRDTVALTINIVLVVFVFAWVNWTLTVLVRRKAYGAAALTGMGLVAVGMSVLVGSWGWMTLGDWPMTPYTLYVLGEPLHHLGLLLMGAGMALWIKGTRAGHLSTVAWGLVLRLLSHLRQLILLTIILWVVVGILVGYILVRVPFPTDVSRIDLTGEGKSELIHRVEGLGIGGLLGQRPIKKEFRSTCSYPIARFIDGDVLSYFLRRARWFRTHVKDLPDFKERGWLRYTAKVEPYSGVVERGRGNLTVTGLNSTLLHEARSLRRWPWDDPTKTTSYWNPGGNTTISGGFVVIMELSYKESCANLGSQEIFLGPQLAIFDKDENLVAVMAPDIVGVRRA